MKKKLIALILTGVMVCNIPVMAKDINEMTLDELKVAYLELQLEYEKLKASIGEDIQTDIEEAVVLEVGGAEDLVLMNEEEFKKDIVDSFNGRSVVAEKYTVSEQNTMTYEELKDYYLECSEAEHFLYEKYRNATFEDLNIQYLCEQYIKGLNKQYESEKIWDDTENFDKFYEQYNSGYYNRAYVIVELSEYYQLPFGDVSSMKENTAYMDSFNEAETRNAAVDHATVQNVQQLLNDIGFFCGSADGISGKRTVKSIKRFQEMYGYEPADGMIDDELVQQLTEVKEQKK